MSKVKKIIFYAASIVALVVVCCSLTVSLYVSAAEISSDVNQDSPAVDPNTIMTETPAAALVVDYSDKLQQLDDGLVVLAQYLEQLQLDLTDLKSSLTVSGNDIEPAPDYSEQLDDTLDKLDLISDNVASILESTTVSENTVSENSLISTPLNDLTFDQQMLVFIICIMFVLSFILIIYSFL